MDMDTDSGTVLGTNLDTYTELDTDTDMGKLK